MKNLIKKYRYNILTDAELEESRKKVSQSDESELEQAIFEDWKESVGADNVHIPDDAKSRIKNRIDSNIGLTNHLWTHVWHFIKVACVILLPLAIATSVFFYYRSTNNDGARFCFATNRGELSTVTLPDSSVVTLNKETTIICYPDSFSRKVRNVIFDGEAYFNVAKDPAHPFVINTRELKVTVMGTKFNLDARNTADHATLYLEEGLVRLTSKLNGESVEIHPNEKAILSYADGRITIVDNKADNNILAWRTGWLEFHDEPLGEVLNTLGRYYNYDLSTENEMLLDSKFTGTIPSDDITLATAILEKAFGTKLKLTSKNFK